MKYSLLLLGLISVSCIRNVEQTSMRPFLMNGEHSQMVANECVKISETGNIFELLGLIKSDMKTALMILEKPGKGAEEQLGVIANRIEVNADKVITLGQPGGNDPYVRHSIQWKLDDSHFGSKNLYVFDPKIQKVFFQGKERPDLERRVSVKQKGNDFLIEYINMGTLLEYCQLNETLMIVFEINHGSFRNPKSLFFNLNVNLEQ